MCAYCHKFRWHDDPERHRDERERFLEYDLTKLVYELSNPKRAVLGVLSALPLNGDPRAMMMRRPDLGQPAVVMTQLRQFFTVKDVALDATSIEPEIQVLLVAHPQAAGAGPRIDRALELGEEFR
jgi:ABC-type uncharacterized transport system involved in gliding motility auxiliary subunit